MSLRTFTVFQDAPSGDVPQPKISRPGAMVTRSQRLASNNASGENVATSEDLAAFNKENLNPATGECAGPSNSGLKKRKTAAVLATKIQPPTATSSKAKLTLKEKDEAQPELGPEQKKRKALAPSSTLKAKASKKDTKGSGKKATRRAGSKKITPMPKLSEEVAAEVDRIAVANANSRCYELTVKPLADVTQAYDEVDVFESFTACATSNADTSDRNVKFSTVKESSVEPEIRDYFKPTQATFPTTGGRLLRALSEDAPTPTFSTPERKKIYSAFTFSSPTAATSRQTSTKAAEPVSPVAEEE
ncbi:hypothetical protein BDN70DRAFT_904784 [Pholiota conissans]|uniref:Uncharacterized protein n=1 Tax=Pholiota conissans TaxID=109636 RepID=A0A9P6CVY2_9AGAR|nr:hypothetical protein BDN70DRAFT_904784 [Pholiota conissans]